ncbi:MAG: hypothetical protein ACREQ5_03125 [Candidatus Dormibacteria bacterium]
MSELPEPTSVERPTPIAEWRVGPDRRATGVRDDFVVRRFAESHQDRLVRVSCYESTLNITPEIAAKLGAAISAAAVWTDEPIVTCSSGCGPDRGDCAAVAADERHTINGDVLRGVVLCACPSWMSDVTTRELADQILADMAQNVTVVRGRASTPWTPGTAAQ